MDQAYATWWSSGAKKFEQWGGQAVDYIVQERDELNLNLSVTKTIKPQKTPKGATAATLTLRFVVSFFQRN